MHPQQIFSGGLAGYKHLFSGNYAVLHQPLSEHPVFPQREAVSFGKRKGKAIGPVDVHK